MRPSCSLYWGADQRKHSINQYLIFDFTHTCYLVIYVVVWSQWTIHVQYSHRQDYFHDRLNILLVQIDARYLFLGYIPFQVQGRRRISWWNQSESIKLNYAVYLYYERIRLTFSRPKREIDTYLLKIMFQNPSLG